MVKPEKKSEANLASSGTKDAKQRGADNHKKSERSETVQTKPGTVANRVAKVANKSDLNDLYDSEESDEDIKSTASSATSISKQESSSKTGNSLPNKKSASGNSSVLSAKPSKSSDKPSANGPITASKGGERPVSVGKVKVDVEERANKAAKEAKAVETAGEENKVRVKKSLDDNKSIEKGSGKLAAKSAGWLKISLFFV